MKNRLKTFLMTAILLLSAAAMAGCGNNSQEKDTAAGQEANDGTADKAADDTAAYPLTITDGLGDEVTIEKKPERAISLSPANTELLFAIGAGDRIKGRTDYCTYPEEAADVESIGTYASPNTELIISLEPDVIFASDHINDSIREQVEAAGAKVIVYSPKDVDAVKDTILQAGQIMDLNENAEKLVASMDADLKELEDAAASRDKNLSVFVDIGSFYSVGSDSLLGDILDRLGVTNIAADTGEAYPQLSVETIIEKDPDIYISLYPTAEELKKTAGIGDLDCIKNDRIIFFEALSPEADTIQRPGPRIAEGMKLLSEQIDKEAGE